jgi:hypothetical protein
MINWTTASRKVMNQFSNTHKATGILGELPDCCNSHWSWTNVYVASDRKLNFFQLRWPNENP